MLSYDDFEDFEEKVEFLKNLGDSIKPLTNLQYLTVKLKDNSAKDLEYYKSEDNYGKSLTQKF